MAEINEPLEFKVNQYFNSFDELMDFKRQYEKSNNSILVLNDSHLNKAEDEISKRCIYLRLNLICKAGSQLVD